MIFAITVLLSALSAKADVLVVDKKTPVITPLAQIYSFEEIDWEKVEKNQDAGKGHLNEDFVVMMCDDSYYTTFEIKFEGFVGKDITVDNQECEFKGAALTYDGTVLQFDGAAPISEDQCTVEVTKKRKDKPSLKMTFGIASSC